MLKARGFDRARLERDIRESLTVNRWVQETVMPSITVSETEQREFFADNQDAMIQPEGVRVRHVLLLVRPKDTADQKAAQRKKAEELRAKIAGGADFAAVAKESSEDPGTAPKGGEVGWIERGQTVPTFEQAAFTLEPGKLSDVVETRFGYHVIQVEEKRPEKKLAFAEVKEQIDALLKQRKLENAVRDRLNALGAKSKIDIKI
jgi:peptidyl-prolyl cis-trans isomerase C